MINSIIAWLIGRTYFRASASDIKGFGSVIKDANETPHTIGNIRPRRTFISFFTH